MPGKKQGDDLSEVRRFDSIEAELISPDRTAEIQQLREEIADLQTRIAELKVVVAATPTGEPHPAKAVTGSAE